MPPSFTDEGVRAALELRCRFADLAVLVLSQYVEESYAVELLQESAEGEGEGGGAGGTAVNANGVRSFSPRLARRRSAYLGKMRAIGINPNGVASPVDSTPLGLMGVGGKTQGSAFRATLG